MNLPLKNIWLKLNQSKKEINNMKVLELTKLAEDTWVNEFEGTITSAANFGAGKGKVSKAKLGDDTGTIDVESWDHDLLNYNNKNVVFNGKGAVIKFDSYNNKVFLKLLKAAKLNVVDGSDAGETAVNQRGLSPTMPSSARSIPADDDFVPQTLCHFIGAAAQIAIQDPESDGILDAQSIASHAATMYKARELAAARIRSGAVV